MSEQHPPTAAVLEQFITADDLVVLVRRVREEDMGPDEVDVTSEVIDPPSGRVSAAMRARQAGVLAGAAAIRTIAEVYDPAIAVTDVMADGSRLAVNSVVARLHGPLASIVAAERVMLNLVGRLCGIATLTAAYVDAVRGTKAKIYDTRKTTPGLRAMEKYAVTCGGGCNHRMGLYDAVLVKDNHLAHLSAAELRGFVTQLVDRAGARRPRPTFVEVEVDTLEQLEHVLPCGLDRVLLDNMPPEVLAQAVQRRDRVAPRVALEASGGVSLKTVRAIAQSGVDMISVGALTHSALSLDVGLDVES